jgi:hypothetical protein
MNLSDSNTESDNDSRKRGDSPAINKRRTELSGSKKRKKKQASSGSDEAEGHGRSQHQHVLGDPTYSTDEERCAFNPSNPGTRAWLHMTRHVSQCFRECINDAIPLAEQRESMIRLVHLYLIRI